MMHFQTEPLRGNRRVYFYHLSSTAFRTTGLLAIIKTANFAPDIAFGVPYIPFAIFTLCFASAYILIW